MRYHKIHAPFKREPHGKRSLIVDDWARPEFQYLANNEWVFTEKIDGTNIRVYFEDGNITIKGRNENSDIPKHVTEALNNIFNQRIGLLKEHIAGNAVLYGEAYGYKIQKMSNHFNEVNFILFDAIINDWTIRLEDTITLANMINIDHVPVLGKGTLYDGFEFVRTKPKSKLGNFTIEGVIAKPSIELNDRANNRIITKIKCVDFN